MLNRPYHSWKNKKNIFYIDQNRRPSFTCDIVRKEVMSPTWAPTKEAANTYLYLVTTFFLIIIIIIKVDLLYRRGYKDEIIPLTWDGVHAQFPRV